MKEKEFPFLAPILEEGVVTICALSDSKTRLRDPWAVYHLVNFLAGRGVEVGIRTMLAGFRRYADSRDLLLDLKPGSAARKRAEEILRDPSLTFEGAIEELYLTAEKARREKIEALRDDQSLPEYGPLVVLGRPRLYPTWFFRSLDAELKKGPSRTGIDGRFRMERDDPLQQPSAARRGFRDIIDTYSQIRLEEVPYPDTGIEEGTFVDYGVIRLVQGAQPSRCALFLFGAGSLGTMGAAHAVVDPAQVDIFASLDVPGLFRTYGAAELLVRVELHSRAMSPWPGKLSRRELEVIGPPIPPVSDKVGRWIGLLHDARDGDVVEGLYACKGEKGNAKRFEVVGIHPPIAFDGSACKKKGRGAKGRGRQREIPEPRAHHLVGGSEVSAVVRKIHDFVAAGERLILIRGEEGTGAGDVARIAYEEAVIELFRRLPEGESAPSPLIPGPRFVEFHAGDASKGDEEGRLAGIVEEFASGNPIPGTLYMAGEGVLHIVDIERLSLGAQDIVLRAAEPPHLCVPVGSTCSFPATALIVASTSADLTEFVKFIGERRMAAELANRLAGHCVEIPPLRDRPGDIPALLASLAGETIRLDERVLRCLLAWRHERNLHGLVRIIDRAKARRGSGSGILPIEESDLDPEMARLFEGLNDENRRRGASARRLLFEFSSVPQNARAAPFFVEAGDILGSLACADRSFFVRPWAPEARQFWPSAKPSNQGDLLRRWAKLVEQALAMRSQPGNGTTAGIDPIELLGRLSHLRWRHNPVRRPITIAFADAYLDWAEKRGIEQKDFAASIQVSESIFSQIVNERRKNRRQAS